MLSGGERAGRILIDFVSDTNKLVARPGLPSQRAEVYDAYKYEILQH